MQFSATEQTLLELFEALTNCLLASLASITIASASVENIIY